MADFIDVEIKDHTPEVLKALEEAIPVILEEWGIAGERFAKERISAVVYDTPQSESYKRTGRLRASITYATKKSKSDPEKPAEKSDGMKKGQVEKNCVVIGTNVEYAYYVEAGTSKMKARPFIKPAIEDNKEQFEKILKSTLDSIGV